MRSLALLTAAGLWLASIPGAGTAKPAEKAEGCSNHGTSVEFLDSPSAAAQKAKKEQKLVFVLHVSGHFEDPKFT